MSALENMTLTADIVLFSSDATRQPEEPPRGPEVGHQQSEATGGHDPTSSHSGGSRPQRSTRKLLAGFSTKLGLHVIWRFPGVNKDGCFPQLMATSPVASPQLTPSLATLEPHSR